MVNDRILEWFGREEITRADAREGALHLAEAFEEDLREVKEKLYGPAAA